MVLLDFHPRTDIICYCDTDNEIQLWNVKQYACVSVSKVIICVHDIRNLVICKLLVLAPNFVCTIHLVIPSYANDAFMSSFLFPEQVDSFFPFYLPLHVGYRFLPKRWFEGISNVSWFGGLTVVPGLSWFSIDEQEGFVIIAHILTSRPNQPKCLPSWTNFTSGIWISFFIVIAWALVALPCEPRKHEE